MAQDEFDRHIPRAARPRGCVDAYCVVFRENREKLSSASKNPGLEGHRKIRRPRAPQLPPPPRFHY